jgi:DNA-binding NarL/FixJ family response regulator
MLRCCSSPWGVNSVHTASTGRDASELLRTHSIAAIVLDVLLGDENGQDLVERFRALSHAPILLLTASGPETEVYSASGYFRNAGSVVEIVSRLIAEAGTPETRATSALEFARRLTDQLRLAPGLREDAEVPSHEIVKAVSEPILM